VEQSLLLPSAEPSSAPSVGPTSVSSATAPTASEIIERWRHLERLLAVADPDGAYWMGLEIEIQRLRHDYQAAMSRAIAQARQLQFAAPSR
jgi:hypothetical protein